MKKNFTNAWDQTRDQMGELLPKQSAKEAPQSQSELWEAPPSVKQPYHKNLQDSWLL